MKIGNFNITESSRPFVIAEIGHNHQGDVETCKELIKAASDAGASAVKLQKRDNKNLFTPEAFNAPYLSENSFGTTYGEHREFLEFNESEYKECLAYAKECGVIFFSTAFDFRSADFLSNLDVPAFKIASGDLKSLPLIKHIASFGKPIILSTGGGTLEDIDKAVSILDQHGNEYAILQCTAAYPPKYDELNLRVIPEFMRRYPKATIGYSGHDSGIAMALVAYVLGARVIEKHFTLNRAMKGTDHAFSLEPQGMRKLVRDIDRARIAQGDGVKKVFESEKAPLRKMGKALYASRDIDKGEIVQFLDVELRSPAAGLEPSYLDGLIGKRLSRNVRQYEPFVDSDLA
jgi:N-acetylneuraminate synthase/sialic acid synthase